MALAAVGVQLSDDLAGGAHPLRGGGDLSDRADDPGQAQADLCRAGEQPERADAGPGAQGADAEEAADDERARAGQAHHDDEQREGGAAGDARDAASSTRW